MRSPGMSSRVHNERGTVLIQVAVAMMALLALTSFSIDKGYMWVARGGAQNAADAGALAGGISLLRGEGDDAAREAAFALATQHRIGNVNTALANVTVTVPQPCPPPWNSPAGCIKVDITKQDVPTFFANIVNIPTQGVQATATAMVGAGNSVQCIKPWVVADKWIDNSAAPNNGMGPGWDQMDTFDPAVDQYVAPGFAAEGPNNDYGTQLVLKEGASGNYTSGWTMQIEFGVSGSNAYRDALSGCPDFVPTVGLYDGSVPCASRADAPNPPRGCLDVKPGMAQGPTVQGVNQLVGQDLGASYNPATEEIEGGCIDSPSGCQTDTGVSPRIVPIAIFNTAAYVLMDAANACNGGNCRAQVVNLIGFFVEGMCSDVYPNQATRPVYCGTNAEANKSVVGRLINYPAQLSSEAGNPGPATFLETMLLVR